MKKSNLCLLLTAVTLALSGAGKLRAVTVTPGSLGTLGSATTLTGTLPNQGTVLEESFTLGSASNLTVYSSSYGGGANADGSTATAGGFMSSLVLYTNTGSYVDSGIFPSPVGKADPKTGLVGDSYLSETKLAAGSYILTFSDFLVQQPPTATNLSDGFIDYGGGTTFTDAQGNLRTGAYALNFSAVPVGGSTATPEPATFALVIPALAGFVALKRRRRAVA